MDQRKIPPKSSLVNQWFDAGYEQEHGWGITQRGVDNYGNHKNKNTTSQQLLTSNIPLKRRPEEPPEALRPAKFFAKGMFMDLIF